MYSFFKQKKWRRISFDCLTIALLLSLALFSLPHDMFFSTDILVLLGIFNGASSTQNPNSKIMAIMMRFFIDIITFITAEIIRN